MSSWPFTIDPSKRVPIPLQGLYNRRSDLQRTIEDMRRDIDRHNSARNQYIIELHETNEAIEKLEKQ